MKFDTDVQMALIEFSLYIRIGKTPNESQNLRTNLQSGKHLVKH